MNNFLKNTFTLAVILVVMHPGAWGQEGNTRGYILEVEKDIARIDTVHFGDGIAIGYSFFEHIEDFNYVFRKRVLKQGAEIKYHLQTQDEIYYILSGRGEMIMNDETFKVESGQAILTRPGSSHGLKPVGDGDLEIIIVYERH